MCNLYSMTASVEELRGTFRRFYGIGPDLPPFDEIRPGEKAPVLRLDGRRLLKFELMTWGLPGPPESDGQPIATVEDFSSPFWRSQPKGQRQPCLVPVTRFCGWAADHDPGPDLVTKRGAESWFRHSEEPVFAFAGICRRCEEGWSMAFLMCHRQETDGAVSPMGKPIILGPREFWFWLRSDFGVAYVLARRDPEGRMRAVVPCNQRPKDPGLANAQRRATQPEFTGQIC